MFRHTVAAICLLGIGHAAGAATFLVTSTADSGGGSLRTALITANTTPSPPHIVEFGPGFPLGGTISLSSALPILNNGRLSIRGNGRAPVISGGGTVNILSVGSSASAIELDGLTLEDGVAFAGGCLRLDAENEVKSLFVYHSTFRQCRAMLDSTSGGAIHWLAGSGALVIVEDSSFFDNAVEVVGTGSGAFGGAMHLRAQASLVRNLFDGNTALAADAFSQSGGGAIIIAVNGSDDRVELVGNRFHGNRTSAAGDISFGGAVFLQCGNGCEAILTGNVFTDNAASGNGQGGALFWGGASPTLGVSPNRLALLNNSFHENFAAASGGALTAVFGEIDARHNTFYRNQAGIGAHLDLRVLSLTTWAFNLLAQPLNGGACELFNASVLLRSGNLHDSNCGDLSAMGALVVAPAEMGDVVFDPDATPYRARFLNSPAIDIDGDQALCEPLDALGVSRPQDGDADGVVRCDAGALENRVDRIFLSGFEQS
jgi:hypothetical protein